MARQRVNAPRRPDGPRAERSINALREGLLKLIESKPLDTITIRNITDAAGVSYPTFFRRFANKEELLEDIAAGEIRDVLLGGVASSDGQAIYSGERLCQHVHERRSLWKVLLTGGGASIMRLEFIRIASEDLSSHPRSNPWIPADLAPSFVASAVFEILTWWMHQPEDYPLRKVIKLFDALIVDMAYRPRKISLD